MLTGPTRLMTQPCLKSTLVLGFKIMIITIFIFICISWIILKLRVLYMDILGKKTKYYLRRHVFFVPHVVEIQKFTLKSS
jgi:hypothetical protein